MKENILKLRSAGKTYAEIQNELKCSKSTISYHCGKGQKDKTKERTRILRSQQKGIIGIKIDTYIRRRSHNFRRADNGIPITGKLPLEFTVNDILNKFGNEPCCYLTGDKIDLNKPATYQFDHRIPVSQGGDNSLSNLELTCKSANIIKSNLLENELIILCKKILKHRGYKVSNPIIKI